MLTLELKTFHQSREGANVTGVIYVELESGAFPAKGWSDFPVILLSWWTEALLQLEVPARREVQWRFMGGMHNLTLTKAEKAPAHGAVELARVKSSLCEAAESVVSYCEEHKLVTKDWETLRANLERLRSKTPAPRKGTGRATHIEIRPSIQVGLPR